MPFSSQIEIQFRDLANEAINRVEFNTKEDILLFHLAATRLIDSGASKTAPSKFHEDILGIQVLINGFDIYATNKIIDMVNHVNSDGTLGTKYVAIPAFTPIKALQAKNSKEEKLKEVKISQND